MLILTLISSIRHTLMQIVYISNRPDTFAETLAHVALLMPFIDKALVCVPDDLVKSFDSLGHAIPIQVVAESEVLDGEEITILPKLDHQRRNYLLRTRLIANTDVNKQFIMSDDDARPLKLIEPDRYVEDKRYRNYFFHNLIQWRSNQTEFDVGQISTGAVLSYLGFPTLSFASHMPQIIDRDIFRQATTFFSAYATEHPLCEWSTYFNYGAAKYTNQFHSPEAYLTLCWPEHPSAWKRFIHQSEYVFENHTPRIYGPKQAFEHIPNKAVQIERSNIQKIIRWQQYTITCLHPEQRSGLLKYIYPRTWVNKLFKHL